MTPVQFEHQLLWVRNGPGPELDVPHCLFAVHLADGEAWTVNPQTLAHLTRILQLDPVADDELALEGKDAIAAFATLSVLLQRRAGHDVRNLLVLPQSPVSAKVAVAHIWPQALRMAAELAAQLVEIICGKLTVPDERLFEVIFNFEKACRPGPMIEHRYLHAAAIKRGIPAVLRPPSDILLGHGKYQVPMHRMVTGRTSHLAVRLASNKTRTIAMLREAGLPVPHHLPVADAAEARAAAGKIGFPVVVKPVNTDRGVGITVGIRSVEELDQAYRHARTLSSEIAVESVAPGKTYRLHVIGGKFVAATRTQPTPIVGDSRSTIRELVNRINMSPLRGPGHLKGLAWIEIDDDARAILASLSLTLESVLPFGRTIRLRTVSNVARGGQSISVTDTVHPDNRSLAEACARIIGLDLAGIDFCSEAIEKSWRDGYGAVIEVNESPGFRLHIAPASGPPADIATPLLGLLFPPGAPSRIPIVAVTGTNGKTTTTRLVAHALQSAGFVTGVATTEEMMVDGRIVERGDCAGAPFARRVLAVPVVEAAVLETARGGIIKHGLGFDRCSVAVVTNVAEDHLGQDGVDTLEDIARVKLTVPRHADTAVLNAGDGLCLAMRSALDGKRIILFSARRHNPVVEDHLAAGGTAYVAEDGAILRRDRERSTLLLAVADVPITFGGRAMHNVENVLAALAALHGLGIDDRTACDAMRSFHVDHGVNPGRLDPVPGVGFEMYFDYAHNKHAFEAMARFVSQWSGTGRKICAVSMPAARVTDAGALDAITALAGRFDHYVTCNDDFPKFRREGFPELLQQGLVTAGVRSDMVTVRETMEEAIETVAAMARRGDLVVVLGGQDADKLILRAQALASRAREMASA